MLLTLENPHLKLSLAPEVGGSIVAFEFSQHGRWWPLMRPTPQPLPSHSSPYASYTLAPYSNRIRQARFRFGDKVYQLQPTNPQGTAQHGDVRNRPWQVQSSSSHSANLFFDSRWFSNLNFPFDFTLQQRYWLDGSSLHTHLRLQNTSQQAMPAGFGLHPYFVRSLQQDPDVWLSFGAQGVYQTGPDLMPVQGMQPVPPELSFANARAVGLQQLDHGFGDWDGMVQMRWPNSGVALRMVAQPVFSHLIVYTAPDGTLAVEPVSHATDGFNLLAQGIQNTGVAVLQPQEVLEGGLYWQLELG